MPASVAQRQRGSAGALVIDAADDALWSDTAYVRRLLADFGIAVAVDEKLFSCWQCLPDIALLAIKWRMARGRPFWPWVVFVRAEGRGRVLDSKRALKSKVRRDFARIVPGW